MPASANTSNRPSSRASVRKVLLCSKPRRKDPDLQTWPKPGAGRLQRRPPLTRSAPRAGRSRLAARQALQWLLHHRGQESSAGDPQGLTVRSWASRGSWLSSGPALPPAPTALLSISGSPRQRPGHSLLQRARTPHRLGSSSSTPTSPPPQTYCAGPTPGPVGTPIPSRTLCLADSRWTLGLTASCLRVPATWP